MVGVELMLLSYSSLALHFPKAPVLPGNGESSPSCGQEGTQALFCSAQEFSPKAMFLIASQSY